MEIQIRDYDQWEDAVKDEHPEVADKLLFRPRIEKGVATISAEVPGRDRSYGVWTENKGGRKSFGVVLASKGTIMQAKQRLLASLENPTDSGVAFDTFIDGEPDTDTPEVQELTRDDGGIEPPEEQSLLMDDLPVTDSIKSGPSRFITEGECIERAKAMAKTGKPTYFTKDEARAYARRAQPGK